jgi:hypothetical protein
MRQSIDQLGIGALLLALGCSASVAEDENVQASTQETYAATNTLWPTALDTIITQIPVCFENGSGYATEIGWVKSAVERTWQRAAWLEFTGFGTCTKSSGGIRIRVEDGNPRVRGGLGRSMDDMILNFTFKNWEPSCQGKREDCIRKNAVHEFGHALGLAHEANHPDSTCDQTQGSDGDTALEYDSLSVMNYCNGWRRTLSAGDEDGIQRLYGGPNYTLEAGRPYALYSYNTNAYLTSWKNYSDRKVYLGTSVGMASSAGEARKVTIAGPLAYGDSTKLTTAEGDIGSVRVTTVSGRVSITTTTYQIVNGQRWTVGAAGTGDSDGSADIHDAITLKGHHGCLGAEMTEFEGRGSPIVPKLVFANCDSTAAVWRLIGPLDKEPF